MNVARFTGNYYIVLGWLGAAFAVFSLFLMLVTGELSLDLSFLIWFWLGHCLKKRSSAARKWALFFFYAVNTILVLCLIIPGATANFGDTVYDRSQPAFYAIMILVSAVFSVPGILLLGQRGRAEFS